MILAHIQRARYILQFPPIITRITNNNIGFVALDKSGKFHSKIAIKNLTLALTENTSATIALVCENMRALEIRDLLNYIRPFY